MYRYFSAWEGPFDFGHQGYFNYGTPEYVPPVSVQLPFNDMLCNKDFR